MDMTATLETHQFQAETRQLLDIVIHSLYTQKEIFLRELVSNASDALDRLRFEALTRSELLPADAKLEIRIEPDKEARTLTIHDSGIGMSRDEVISHIGTIAKSGTRELMAKIKESKSSDIDALIGQFGVGFYSSFMVADKVTLLTRRAGEETASLWESNGEGQYTLVDAEKPSCGTSITLHLKKVDAEDGIEDFTDSWVISRIVKRYSDFVRYPIILKAERDEWEHDEEGKRKDDSLKKVIEEKTLNSMKPIWTRPEADVTEEEYAEFYKHVSHDWNPPLKHISLKAEGRIEYQALLFIPSQAPYDLFYVGSQCGLELFVKRVMIMDRCEDLLPRHLRFVKGVVDSADLPLNISRERMQHDRHITQIRRFLTKNLLDTLSDLQQNDQEKYLTVWNEFGRCLKEGIGSDYENKDKLVSLCQFESSHDPAKLTTFKDYVGRMKPDQNEIYYLTGESRAVVENSPHLEAFREKAYEVLYLLDPVDELVVQSLSEFEGKKLKSAGKGNVKLGTEEEKKKAEEELQEKQKEYASLLELLQKRLDENIKEVRLSTRLTASPACLVGAEHDYSPQLERLLQKGKGGGAKQRRIMELNPKHAIVTRLHDRFEKNKEDPLLGDYAELLLGYALLAEGSELTDPVGFNRRVAELMAQVI